MKNVFLLIAFSLLLINCEKEDSFDSSYNFIYGDWVPTQIASGMGIADPKLLGELIQIIPKNNYKIIKNNEVVESGNINILTQTVDNLALKFKPEKIDPDYLASVTTIRISRHTLNLFKYSNDSVGFHNNAFDGGYFGIKLSRK